MITYSRNISRVKDVDVYQEDGTLSLVNEMRSAESSFIEKVYIFSFLSFSNYYIKSLFLYIQPIKCVENPPKGSQKSDSIQDDKAQEILPLQPVSTLNPNSLVTVYLSLKFISLHHITSDMKIFFQRWQKNQGKLDRIKGKKRMMQGKDDAVRRKKKRHLYMNQPTKISLSFERYI